MGDFVVVFTPRFTMVHTTYNQEAISYKTVVTSVEQTG